MAPYVDFLLIGGVGAVVTFLATFVVRRLAFRFRWLVVPDARRVHKAPTATVGGAGMFLGFLVAMAVASRLSSFSSVFKGDSEPLGLVLGAAVIFFVGMTDDLREMSPPAKLAGQILAGTVLYVFGVTMLDVRLPLAHTTVLLSAQLAPVLTVLWVVMIANAINLIDGLDGLATGVVGIASLAFFVYSHELLTGAGTLAGVGSGSGPVVAAILCGICVGFLPHNFHPARIFMGDAGAMLLGLLMAGSTMSVVGQTSQTTSGRTFFTFAPIVIPFFILAIPLADTAFAVLRRARRRVNFAEADKNHLHHRLMRLGHGQRRSVLILWAWTALLSVVVLYPSITDYHHFLVPVVVLALALILVAMFARGRRKGPPEPLPMPVVVHAPPDRRAQAEDPTRVLVGARPSRARRADTGAGAQPDTYPRTQAETGADCPPEARLDNRPARRPDSRPEQRADSRPERRADSRPERRAAGPAEGRPVRRPEEAAPSGSGHRHSERRPTVERSWANPTNLRPQSDLP